MKGCAQKGTSDNKLLGWVCATLTHGSCLQSCHKNGTCKLGFTVWFAGAERTRQVRRQVSDRLLSYIVRNNGTAGQHSLAFLG